jgi:hypothetical protein
VLALSCLHRPSIKHYWRAHADAQHRYDGTRNTYTEANHHLVATLRDQQGRAALSGRYGTAMPPHEKRAAVSSRPRRHACRPSPRPSPGPDTRAPGPARPPRTPAGRPSSLVPPRLPPRDRADRSECREFLGLRHRRYAWHAVPQPPSSNSTPASCQQVRLAGPSRRCRPGTRPRPSPPAARSRTYSRPWPRTVSTRRRRRCTAGENTLQAARYACLASRVGGRRCLETPTP